MTALLRSRRALVLGLLAAPFARTAMSVPKPHVEVWKSPTCGCCKDWIAHMEASGFAVQVHETGNNPVRRKLGMPAELGSCHTATVGGYVIEGHVPAADILRLLRDQPKALGLAVPGMVIGSPGMDGPAYQGRRDPFDVLLVGQDGRTRVFRRVT